jgi:hypothetical protein
MAAIVRPPRRGTPSSKAVSGGSHHATGSRRLLGHSNLAMTRHYEHVLAETLQDAAHRLEGWLARGAAAR